MHNITVVNTCTGCHYSFEAMKQHHRPDRYVDSGMYNTKPAQVDVVYGLPYAGAQEHGARRHVRTAMQCRQNPITDKDRHNITSTPSTYSVGGNNVVGITGLHHVP